jgi:SAM-dependent methyltransferase
MYDTLYASKDYGGECDRVEAAFRLAQRNVSSILDLGCGTGGHAIPLGRRGYTVYGVDRSPDMIQRACSKASQTGGTNAEFHVDDLQTVRLNQSFDACLLMFAVLGYQTTNHDVIESLRNVQRHLEPGGVFVFDVWNGLAVLKEAPSERMRVVSDGDRRLIRFSSGTLDVRRHLCHVHAHQMLVAGERIVAEAEETHAMRYFFPLELELFLDHSGFDVVDMTPFDHPEHPLDASTWNMLVVARRR